MLLLRSNKCLDIIKVTFVTAIRINVVKCVCRGTYLKDYQSSAGINCYRSGSDPQIVTRMCHVSCVAASCDEICNETGDECHECHEQRDIVTTEAGAGGQIHCVATASAYSTITLKTWLNKIPQLN